MEYPLCHFVLARSIWGKFSTVCLQQHTGVMYEAVCRGWAEKNGALHHLASHCQTRPRYYASQKYQRTLAWVILPSVDNVYTAGDLSSQQQGEELASLFMIWVAFQQWKCNWSCKADYHHTIDLDMAAVETLKAYIFLETITIWKISEIMTVLRGFISLKNWGGLFLLNYSYGSAILFVLASECSREKVKQQIEILAQYKM